MSEQNNDTSAKNDETLSTSNTADKAVIKYATHLNCINNKPITIPPMELPIGMVFMRALSGGCLATARCLPFAYSSHMHS